MFRQRWCEVVCLAFFVSAALCSNFQYEECVRLDGTVQVTFSVSKDDKVVEEKTLFLENATEINGTCANASDSAAAMRIRFGQEIEWDLIFMEDNKSVELDQILTIVPAQVFNNNFFSGSVDLDVGKFVLSKRGRAFKCDSSLNFTFVQRNDTSDGRNYSATLVFSNLIVQAFDLENGTFTAADTCDQDMASAEPDTTAATSGTSAAAETTEAKGTSVAAETTEVPTEVPTTMLPPPVTPDFPPVGIVSPSSFELKGQDNVTCFLLDAGLQMVIEYKTNSSHLYTRPIHLTSESTTVNGSCSNVTAVMNIITNDTELTITQTKESAKVTTKLQLKVTLDNKTFPNASESGKTIEFSMTASTLELDSTRETFLRCNSFQRLRFDGETNTTVIANNVTLQSFGLDKGKFSGDGVQCLLDPVPPENAERNKYVVNGTFELCIVFLAKISFENVTYLDTNNKIQTKTFNISAALNKDNETQVFYNGTCGANVNSTEERLEITFNKNWTLTLTFAEAIPHAKEYSLRDVVLNYYEGLEYFPDTSEPGKLVTVSATNLTGFLKANGEGTAYKCDAEVTQKLGDGVEMKLSQLQYKAFNQDYSDSFNNVSDCAADEDGSNSVVPIAVGAALAGLVVIVLIAYLIGRKRSRRQGYESV